MTFNRFAMMASFLGACGVALLSQGGALTIASHDGAALSGPSAAAHAELEQLESAVPAGRTRNDQLWKAHLDLVETELAAGHVDAAVRAWHDAYGAALHTRSWESMIAVGDAFMEIGRATSTPRGAHMNARDAYLTALIRAQRNHSAEGALRSAQAFGELGERVLVEQSLHIAAQLASGSDEMQQRVSEARLRLENRQTAAEF